jgi:hypothetical protein
VQALKKDKCKLYKGRVQALQRTSAGATKDEGGRYKGGVKALQRTSAGGTKDEAGAAKDECRRFNGG